MAVRLRRLSAAAREAAKAAAADRQARNRAIGEAADLGWSVGQLEDVTQLSTAQVERIIIQQAAEAQARAEAREEFA